MKNSWKRLISALLSVVMIIAIALPAVAYDFGTDSGTEKTLEWEKVSDKIFTDALKRKGITTFESEPEFSDDDVVRVSIILNAPSVIGMGYSTEKIAANAGAMQYRKSIKSEQDKVATAISKRVLNGAELDVVWNLTLAANIISANVPYGKISAIKAVAGVKNVVLETQYYPDKAAVSDEPQMSVASGMVGTPYAWASGYTGAGSKVAIIDTGIDTDHQSFSSEAFDYAIAEVEEETGKTVDLLTLEEVAAILDQLHVSERYEGITAEDLYYGSKLPFAFNYVDNDLDVTHDLDNTDEHGSHVAGIAAANRYIKTEEGFVDALPYVKTQGEAPDAQIITMKVFGKGGGAYDSDYMIAIEDAIVLGCDSVNLSLGSAATGLVRNSVYQEIMDELANTSTVVVMSGGNSYSWANFTTFGYLYYDDVNFGRTGSPGSYTNSLAVASVDNDGTTGPYLTIDNNMVFYAESTTYGNDPISSIGGKEYEYIYIDSIGQDYEFAAVADVLEGKIAICNRGEISFYVKANNAVENGAVATIIANNEDGVIMMNLTGYLYNNPAVTITMVDAELIKECSEYVEDEDISYYTGTIYVGNTIGSVAYDSFFYKMSDFSSWGINGNLELKPEITAPGGSIYSVNGKPKETDQYESMSGTSMAAPQIAGIAAVLAQYLRENGIPEKTGLTTRQLTNSLLMSTAEPLVEEEADYQFYSVLKQGAGLVSVNRAIAAHSYILMDESATASAKDGKVKAEIGETDGEFSVKFTVNNFTDEEIDAYLDSTFFTQDTFQYYVFDGEGNALADENGDPVLAAYLDTWTYPLEYTVSWKINGEDFIFADDPELTAKYDVNNDGWWDEFDAHDLLAFITGDIEELGNIELADVNGDGMINTADAYELLRALSAATATVPANGSLEIEAIVSVDPENFYNYNYIEGYIYVTEADNGEWNGVIHSIPVVGFYGDWSEPSMFDKGSLLEYAYGEEYRTPYMMCVYGDEALTMQQFVAKSVDFNAKFAFGGNPMILDPVYLPERNAVSDNTYIDSVQYTQIRNSGAERLRVYADGEPVFEEILGPSYAAYYDVNKEAWFNTVFTDKFGFKPTGLADGTELTYEITMAPEYFVDDEGNVDWDALGDGTSMRISAIVDNTAPEIKDLTLGYVKDERAFGLSLKASDNQYVSYVEVGAFTDGDFETIDYLPADLEAKAGDEYDMFLPLDLYAADQNGNLILLYPYIYVIVYDYALNASVYKINLNSSEFSDPELDLLMNDELMIIGNGTAQIDYIPLPWGIEDEEGFTVTFESSDETVVTVDENGLVKSVADGDAEAIVYVTAQIGESSCTLPCYVSIVFLDVKLNGVIWDENGEVWFSEFDIMKLPEYTKLTETKAPAPIGATAIDAKGKMFAATIDEDDYSNLFIVNDDYSLEMIGTSSIAFFDLAAAPCLGENRCLAVYGQYLLVVDMSIGDYIGAFDLSSVITSDIVGIAYEERTETGYGTADVYFMIDREGNLYEEAVVSYNGGAANFTPVLLGNLGYETDHYKYNSLYFDGTNLYWSKFSSASDNVELIMIYDIYNVGAIVNLGAFDDSVWPVGGIYEEGFSLPMYYYSGEGTDRITDKGMNMVLNGFAADSIESAAAGAGKHVTRAADAENTVTKDLVSDKDINNGLIILDYDPEAVALELDTELDYINANEIEEGHILIAFADDKTIEAGTVIATVTATLINDAEASVVYIEYKEGAAATAFDTIILGEATPEEQTTVVVTDVAWNWSEDHSEATATFSIEGGDPVTLDAEIISKTTATCLLDGYNYQIALVRFNDTVYVDMFTEEAEAHGHLYGEPEWNWESDLSGAYLWITCEYYCLEEDWNLVFAAEATVEEVEPTCSVGGSITYTVEVDIMDYVKAAEKMAEYYLENYGSMEGYIYYMELAQQYLDLIETLGGQSYYTDSVTVYTLPTGHDYELIGWEWADDLSSATATFKCSECGIEQTVEDTEIECELIDGTYMYTATVEFLGDLYSDAVSVTVAGDADGDGVLTGKDLIRLRKFLVTYDPDLEEQEVEIFPGADVNNDGKVDGRDLIALRKLLIEA